MGDVIPQAPAMCWPVRGCPGTHQPNPNEHVKYEVTGTYVSCDVSTYPPTYSINQPPHSPIHPPSPTSIGGVVTFYSTDMPNTEGWNQVDQVVSRVSKQERNPTHPPTYLPYLPPYLPTQHRTLPPLRLTAAATCAGPSKGWTTRRTGAISMKGMSLLVRTPAWITTKKEEEEEEEIEED